MNRIRASGTKGFLAIIIYRTYGTKCSLIIRYLPIFCPYRTFFFELNLTVRDKT